MIVSRAQLISGAVGGELGGATYPVILIMILA
jgi:hypothetical protein